LTLSWQWPQATPALIDQQSTSIIEGAMATIAGLREIRSTSRPGQAQIELGFDPERNMGMARFEVAARLRQLRDRLPLRMTYPHIDQSSPDAQAAGPLLTYTLRGEAPPAVLHRYAEEQMVPLLAQLPGVATVEAYGGQPHAWELQPDAQRLGSQGLSPQALAQSIQGAFTRQVLTPTQTYQALPPQEHGSLTRRQLLDWPIEVSSLDSPLLMRRLGDLMTLRYHPQSPLAYLRINGLSAVTLVIRSESGRNQLQVAKQVDAEVAQMRRSLPPGYTLAVSDDATEFLRQELTQIGWRSGLALGLLLLFVGWYRRSWRYLGQMLLSLWITLGLAALGAYLLGVELHLYSLAGLTLAFGLMIDNSLVMSDHLRQHGDRGVFLALLAATLTTLGALSIVYALEEEVRLHLLDFVQVMALSLLASLAVAWWWWPVVPGTEKTARTKRSMRRKRRVLKWLHGYGQFLRMVQRRRGLWLLAGGLGFGLPVFLLPREVEGWPRYHLVIGSETYQQEVKPWVDRLLGGSLRLFMEETFPRARYQEPVRTALFVDAKLPYGTTIEQMNETMRPLEHFLGRFSEIDQFQTTIRSSQDARIVVYVTPEGQRNGLPYRLKAQVIQAVNALAGADWSVYGVGQGFSNATNMGSKGHRIVLKGYDYQQLLRHAERLQADLLAETRIQEVFVNGEWRDDYRPHDQLRLQVDTKALALAGQTPQMLWQRVQAYNLAPRPLRHLYLEGEYAPLWLRPRNSLESQRWQVMQQPVALPAAAEGEGRVRSPLKLATVARLTREPTSEAIVRVNQEYQLLLEYDFLGPNELARRVQRRLIDQTNDWLPLGYQVDSGQKLGRWTRKERMQYGLLLPVLLIIFGLCAILLESLRQPLVILSLVPLSFIGTFLVFYWSSANFDQGGYAALLLLSGVSVNAGLYLINDYNRYRHRYPRRTPWACYLKAVHSKLMPILLTILSTLLGMIPFVIGEEAPFWYALALGTMGGLVFSLLAVLVYLPLVVSEKK
jgi:multidrug efflux pump subunit AcrB